MSTDALWPLMGLLARGLHFSPTDIEQMEVLDALQWAEQAAKWLSRSPFT